MRVAAGLCAAALAVAWIALCHALMTRWPAWPWNGVVVVGPMLGGLVALGLQRRWPLVWIAAGATLAGLAAAALGGEALPLESLYVAQHAGVHGALAAVFAASLGGDRESLVTALARRVHGGRLTPPMQVYSRQVTVAWSIYFAAMALLSIGLYVAAPFAVWADFANLATPLAMALLFVGEHALRYRLHPEFERATLGAALRAWQRHRLDEPVP